MLGLIRGFADKTKGHSGNTVALVAAARHVARAAVLWPGWARYLEGLVGDFLADLLGNLVEFLSNVLSVGNQVGVALTVGTQILG